MGLAKYVVSLKPHVHHLSRSCEGLYDTVHLHIRHSRHSFTIHEHIMMDHGDLHSSTVQLMKVVVVYIATAH